MADQKLMSLGKNDRPENRPENRQKMINSKEESLNLVFKITNLSLLSKNPEAINWKLLDKLTPGDVIMISNQEIDGYVACLSNEVGVIKLATYSSVPSKITEYIEIFTHGQISFASLRLDSGDYQVSRTYYQQHLASIEHLLYGEKIRIIFSQKVISSTGKMGLPDGNSFTVTYSDKQSRSFTFSICSGYLTGNVEKLSTDRLEIATIRPRSVRVELHTDDVNNFWVDDLRKLISRDKMLERAIYDQMGNLLFQEVLDYQGNPVTIKKRLEKSNKTKRTDGLNVSIIDLEGQPFIEVNYYNKKKITREQLKRLESVSVMVLSKRLPRVLALKISNFNNSLID